MKFKVERTDINIPDGDMLLEKVKDELNDNGSLYVWTIIKILIYLLMRDQGKDVF